MSSPKETETPELVHLKVLEAVWSNLARKQGAEGISLVNDVDGRLPNVPPNFRWVESNYALWGFYTLFTQDLCKYATLRLPGHKPCEEYKLRCDKCAPCGIGDPCECIMADDEDFDGAYDCVHPGPHQSTASSSDALFFLGVPARTFN